MLPSHPNAKAINAELKQMEAKISFLAEHLHNKGRLNLDTLREELKGKKNSLQYISVLFEELLSESKQSHINARSGRLSCSFRD